MANKQDTNYKQAPKCSKAIPRVYISGGISGHSDKENEERFGTAKKHLNAKGYLACSPWLLHEYGLEYGHYIEIDLKVLGTCDAIYMLAGWEKSSGARQEKAYAEKLGLEVIYEEPIIDG